MDFIKRMKKREFVEMTLKAITALLVLFILVVLMEGMIYGIELNSIEKRVETVATRTDESIDYCVKEGDGYKVYVHYIDAAQDTWYTDGNIKSSKSACESLTHKAIYFRYPTAFELTLDKQHNGYIHYIVIAVLTAGVIGFYTYRFIKIGKTYKKIEDNFNATGTIEF